MMIHLMTVFKIVMVNGVEIQNQTIAMSVIMTLQMIVFKTVTGFGVELRDLIPVVNVKVWENKFSIWMMTVMDLATVKWYSNIAPYPFRKDW